METENKCTPGAPTGTTECGPGTSKSVILTAVVAVQDDSSHWYVIPKHLEEEFSELLNISIGEGQEAEQAETEFIEKFSGYMTNGDVNNVQLYAEI